MRPRMIGRLAVVLLSILLARPARAQRFELSRDTALADEPVGIVVAGLAPGAMVTVRLTVRSPSGSATSAATFAADAGGRVDLARDSTIAGDYRGVHAMGLFWSLLRDSVAADAGPLRRPVAAVPPPVPAILSAEVGGRIVASDTLWQRALDPRVRLSVVRDSGLTAVFYQPPGAGAHPAIIVVGGSLGGLTPPRGPTGGLASRGYAVLSLAYFAADGVPEQLANVPLEYFERAIRWLASQPSVDSTRIGIYGTSRGGELALLLGATYPRLRVVVANLPSHVAWPGMMGQGARGPAWTLGGVPVPYMDSPLRPSDVARVAGCTDLRDCPNRLGLHNFVAQLEDERAQERAAIPVERINGAVLLVAGKSDSTWPSARMADLVVQRLRRHGFRHPVEHYAYDDAGHGIARPYASTRGVVVRNPHPVTGNMNLPGGSPAGTALASEDAWRRTLAFLDRYLRR